MVCPPLTRRLRNGKAGWMSVDVVWVLRAWTSRGVRACACMWWTASRGICQATARPFAVLSPVERLLRMPGPRVTVMKSGLRLRLPSCSLSDCSRVDASSAGADGSECRDLFTRSARLCACESRARRGLMPLLPLLSAVIRSWKWSAAKSFSFSDEGSTVTVFSRIEADVSSLNWLAVVKYSNRTLDGLPGRFNCQRQ